MRFYRSLSEQLNNSVYKAVLTGGRKFPERWLRLPS